MGYKKLFTDMIKKTYTMYSEIINLQKIIIKIGEALDNYGFTVDSENETLKLDKSIKVDGHIMNDNETFDVDTDGNATVNTLRVTDEISFADGTIMNTVPHLYLHKISFGEVDISGLDEWYYITFCIYSPKSTKLTLDDIRLYATISSNNDYAGLICSNGITMAWKSGDLYNVWKFVLGGDEYQRDTDFISDDDIEDVITQIM